VLIEKKAFSVVFHYRMAEVESIESVLNQLKAEISALNGIDQVEILAGKKNLEVRVKGIGKGHVIKQRMQDGEPAFCLAIGDDATDADMFAAVQGYGLALAVGRDFTDAHYKLRDSAMVREFLRMLEEHFRKAKRSISVNLNGTTPSGVE
jgi:trehalose 6-phosphate synthase/phosphatase